MLVTQLVALGRNRTSISCLEVRISNHWTNKPKKNHTVLFAILQMVIVAYLSMSMMFIIFVQNTYKIHAI